MMRPLALLLSLATALPAAAQSVPDQSTAKKQLFGTRASTLTVIAQPFLSAAEIATLQAMPEVATLTYYGALAVAPAAGLEDEASTGSFNYHSLEAARAAAIAGCNAKRRGGPACAVVAEVSPRSYAPGRALTLSQDATRAVDGRAFRRAGRDAALAISPGT
ncbi:MAG: hypothetical protein WBA25_13225, partial [Jannaschia sp.]